MAEQQAAAHQKILDLNPRHPCEELFRQRIAGMAEAAARLRRIPAAPCESFKDAVQCIFIMNAALHWTGELTSLGRLDQLLETYYEQDKVSSGLTTEGAQEVIDCLWVKLDERVMLNRRHFEDRFSSADGALLGGGGPSNFDQGALANQWMQQVTLGGVKATKSKRPVDASNDITRMCLHAARKFPFNCPTVDLRVHSKTPADLLVLAARAMLSGGAHPILMNDDKIVAQLHEHSGGTVALESARNYACDGCYETLFPGETEFSFFYVPAIDVLEKALNSGAGFLASGAINLRGSKSSLRTPPADQIHTFEELYAILEQHLWLGVNRQFGGVLQAYGSKRSVCASPILSAMITGCLEASRDFYDGGARYHMFAPLMTGISTVADSLYVIEELVFRQRFCTLPELVSCLRSDWSEREEVIGLKSPEEHIKTIRERCRSQPKFGTGDARVDQYAWRLIHREHRTLLRNGHWRRVVEELTTLAANEADDSKVWTEIAYLQKHGDAGRLKYPSFRGLGLPIGSGAIESSIRRVINLRLKGNAIYWREENAEAMLQLRAQLLTDRWDDRLGELRQLRSRDARSTWQWKPQDMSSKAERAAPPGPNP